MKICSQVALSCLFFRAVLVVFSAAGAAAFAQASPILHYTFDEGVGTTANDLAGSQEDGTLVNMEPADWIAGRVGAAALMFDGTDERVTSNVPPALLPANLAAIGSGDLSVSAWIKSTTSDGAILAIGGDFGSGSPSNHGLALTTAGLSLSDGRDAPKTGRVEAAFGTPVNTGLWVHVTGVRDGGTLRVFRNGVEVGTEAFPDTADVSGNALGGGNRQMTVGLALKPSDQSVKLPFVGSIDDVAVFDRAVSPLEAKTLFTASNQPGLELNASEISELIAAFDASQQRVEVGGFVWQLIDDGSLPGTDGDVFALGNGNFGIHLDSGNGFRTFIPEPSGLALLSVGLLFLARHARRRLRAPS